jgi:hypothetical protein
MQKKKPIKIIDKNKKIRDASIDATLEDKLIKNLQWSILMFVFNQICHSFNEEEDTIDPFYTQKEFFRHWKKFINDNIIKEDIEMINNELNSDINLFSAALSNENEMIETTEIYQQKYYSILNKIETFFLNSIAESE